MTEADESISYVKIALLKHLSPSHYNQNNINIRINVTETGIKKKTLMRFDAKENGERMVRTYKKESKVVQMLY